MIAVAVTLVATVFLGLSSVMEQRSAKQVPQRGALSPRLLVDLARRRQWLAAIGVNVIGNAAQVVALHYGALALVQPLIVFNLLFAVLFTVLAGHYRPDWIMVTGLIFCSAGIAWFLAVAHPSGGRETVSFAAAVPLMAGLAAVVACCLAAAHWGPRPIRPLWLALACGVDFGVNALLLKLVPDTLPEGFSDPARQWPLYMLVIVGPVGFLLNQNAFQAGILISPVLAVITTADPLVSIGIAHFWLKETVASTPAALAAEAVALALMAGGIYALAHRAPHVARQELAGHSYASVTRESAAGS
jgi:drug/metabolite transporter (DMT)-like permease